MHSRKKRWNAAVIGLGKIGLLYDFEQNREKPSSHVLAYELHPEIDLVGAVDVHPERRDLLLKVAPDASFYTDIKLLLREQELDIISVCTPPNERLELIRIILKNSSVKAIFCEKPLGENLEMAVQLREILDGSGVVFIPNLSRRWNGGISHVKRIIQSSEFGQLLKIHVRYTRGIYNTGAHVFDLIRHLCGDILEVRVTERVFTTAESENDPSFSFNFQVERGVSGHAEAFNDQHYYMFEMDLYCSKGKIEIYRSGDQIRLYNVGKHPLFDQFNSLHEYDHMEGLLAESNLKNAVDHIARVLERTEMPICGLSDGLYPLYIAEALQRSYENRGSLEKVACINE